MSRRNQLAPYPGRRAVRRLPVWWTRAGKVAMRGLPLLICVASIALLQAQTSAPSANSGTTAPAASPSTSPAHTAPALAGPSALPPFPISGFGAGTAGFGQNSVQSQYQPADPFGRGSFNPRQWNGPTRDPFQPGPSFDSYSGSSGSAMGFSRAGGFGMGLQGSWGSNPFAGFGMGGRQSGAAPLFPAGSAFSPYGTAPLALPSLNQFLRGSFSLPFDSAPGSFRLSYRDPLRPGVNFGDLARPSTSLMFSTPDLGNGVFLSAGTGLRHSVAGAPAAGLGSSSSGDAKHSGPSVAVKLSF